VIESRCAFQVAVLREMLTGLEKVYDEAYKQGKITQIVEYREHLAARSRGLDAVPATS
jgi:hypothetical protein